MIIQIIIIRVFVIEKYIYRPPSVMKTETPSELASLKTRG